MSKTSALLVSSAFVLAAAAGDRLAAPALGDVRVNGLVGEHLEQCLRSRVHSDWARGPLVDEAVNAFRTHRDDVTVGWQNEYWGKTFLCFAGALEYSHDPALKTWALDRAHAFVDEFQQPNGYLSTYAREDFVIGHPDDPNPRNHWCFNVWGRKYTFWALVDLHRATGDVRCLAAAEKMARHLIDQLKRLNRPIEKTGAWWGVSSMSILKPMLVLHEITGKAEYLDFCRGIYAAMDGKDPNPGTLVRNAFLKKPIKDWYPEPGYWAKAYEIMSCLEGLVEYHRVTGETRALDAVKAFHGHLVEEELNPMRSVGVFDHFLGGRRQFNGISELCDVTHWIRLNRELFLLTGETRYADLAEEAFFNAFLAGVSRDGRWGAHGVRSHGTRHWWAPAQTGMQEHQCCPDNMMRTYFDVATLGAVRTADGVVAVTGYFDGETRLAEDKVVVSGGYPYSDGATVVAVHLARAGKVRFRVPGWSTASFTVNGRAVQARDGWAEVEAPAGATSWRLGFDFAPRFVEIPVRWPVKMPPSPQQSSVSDIPCFVVHCMEALTPDMVGLVRNEVGTLVMRGPLLLAKGRLAGTPRAETLFASPIRGQHAAAHEPSEPGWKWHAELRRETATAATAGVPAVWHLTLTLGQRRVEAAVADFAHLSNLDDPDNWFSPWF